MMPLSFNGFGAYAILAMVFFLIASQAFRYVRGHFHKKQHH